MGRTLPPGFAPRCNRLHVALLSAGLLLVVGFATASTAVLCSHHETEDQYLRVEVRGVLRHGVQALGEATTGTEITARGVTWELDLSAADNLGASARTHNGQVVTVGGLLEMQRRADMQCRWIVRVEKLSAQPRP